MRNKGTLTYVYGVLNKEDKIIYVGKSCTPKLRLINHKQYEGYTKAVILDIFYDIENYWIEKLLEQGSPLQNKETLQHVEDHSVGDIVEVHDRLEYSIRDKESGKVYKGFKSIQKDFPELSDHYLRRLLGIKPVKLKSKQYLKIESKFNLEVL